MHVPALGRPLGNCNCHCKSTATGGSCSTHTTDHPLPVRWFPGGSRARENNRGGRQGTPGDAASGSTPRASASSQVAPHYDPCPDPAVVCHTNPISALYTTLTSRYPVASHPITIAHCQPEGRDTTHRSAPHGHNMATAWHNAPAAMFQASPSWLLAPRSLRDGLCLLASKTSSSKCSAQVITIPTWLAARSPACCGVSMSHLGDRGYDCLLHGHIPYQTYMRSGKHWMTGRISSSSPPR